MNQMKFAVAGFLLALFATEAFPDQPVGESAPELMSTQEQEEMCAKIGCQRNVRIVLKQQDGTVYDKTFPVFTPVVQPTGITVAAGQTIYVEASIKKGRLVDIKSVDKVINPEKTLTATLTQDERGGMMLHITSPFEEKLKFDMGIMPLDKEDVYKTSSCPIDKGSFELWAEPIFLVMLKNGRVVKKSFVVCD